MFGLNLGLLLINYFGDFTFKIRFFGYSIVFIDLSSDFEEDKWAIRFLLVVLSLWNWRRCLYKGPKYSNLTIFVFRSGLILSKNFLKQNLSSKKMNYRQFLANRKSRIEFIFWNACIIGHSSLLNFTSVFLSYRYFFYNFTSIASLEGNGIPTKKQL